MVSNLIVWSRDAKRAWLIALLAYVAISVGLALYYCRVSPSPDQSLFDYMAWLDLHGTPFYRGSFDMTWPGQLVIHELGIALLGVHPWTARLTDFIYLQFGVTALVLFARSFGFARAGWIVLFAYPLIYVTSGGWMAGHRDLIAMHWLILAAAIVRRDWRAALLMGLCCGYAVATRPTYLSFVPLVVCFDVLSRRGGVRAFLPQATGVTAGLVIVALSFAIVGWERDSLSAWYEDSIAFVVTVYPAHRGNGAMLASLLRILRDLWWITGGAVVGALVLVEVRGVSIIVLRLIALLTVVLVSYFAQNKGFGYHLGGLIPLFTLVMAIGIDLSIGKALERASRLKWFYTVVAIVLSLFGMAGLSARIRNNLVPVLVQGQVSPRDAKRDAMANLIARRSNPGDTVFQVGWNYDVVFLAQRPAPTALTNTPAINLIDQRAGHFVGWIDQLRGDLARKPPRFLLIDTNDWPGAPTSSSQSLMRAAIAQVIARSYVVQVTTPTMKLYQRRDR